MWFVAGGIWMITNRATRALLGFVLSGSITLLFTLPLIWVIAASLRQPGLPPPRSVEWLPNPLVTANYSRLFDLIQLGRFIVNSLLIVGFAVPVTLLTASWAGFAMAQSRQTVRRRLMVLAVLLLMVPMTALWLTRFVLFSTLSLIDTYWVLVLPAAMGSSPLFVLLFYWTFRRISPELFEAARLESAGPLRLWWSVALPLARPTIVTVAVLTFTLYWSDFTTPLLYLKSEQRYPLSMGLQMLQQMDQTNWPLLMAAVVVMSGPVIGMFLLVQRYFWPEGRVANQQGVEHD